MMMGRMQSQHPVTLTVTRRTYGQLPQPMLSLIFYIVYSLHLGPQMIWNETTNGNGIRPQMEWDETTEMEMGSDHR